MKVAARKDGYAGLSIVVHWLAAAIVVILFATQEGDRGSAAYVVHVGGGAIAGVFLLWRVWHRIRQGMTDKSDQAFALNLASQVVIWGFLAAIVVVVLTGYLIPWSEGRPLDVLGLVTIPSPMAANRTLSEIVEELHELAGQLFLPLLALHLLGWAKHAFIDRDGVAARMFRSVSGGR